MTGSLDEIATRFEDRAPTYDESALHRDLDGVSTVLDVATGTGLVLRSLPVGPHLIGIDISPGTSSRTRSASSRSGAGLMITREELWSDGEDQLFLAESSATSRAD